MHRIHNLNDLPEDLSTTQLSMLYCVYRRRCTLDVILCVPSYVLSHLFLFENESASDNLVLTLHIERSRFLSTLYFVCNIAWGLPLWSAGTGGWWIGYTTAKQNTSQSACIRNIPSQVAHPSQTSTTWYDNLCSLCVHEQAMNFRCHWSECRGSTGACEVWCLLHLFLCVCRCLVLIMSLS